METTIKEILDDASTMNFTSAGTIAAEKEIIVESADRYFLSMDGELLHNNKYIFSGSTFGAEFEIF